MLEGTWEATSAFFNSHPVEISLTAITAVAVGAIVWGVREIIHAKDKKYMHEYVPRIRTKTLTAARYAYVDDLFANKIKFVVEKLVQDQAITRMEANERYRRLNKGFRNKNFIPSVFLLKAALKARRQAKTLHPTTSTKEITPNGTVVKTNVVKGSFGDKSRRRSPPKSA